MMRFRLAVVVALALASGAALAQGAPSGGTSVVVRSGTVTVTNSAFDITDRVGRALGIVSVSGSVAVTGTFWQGTQPVSLASLPSLAAGSSVIGSISNTSFGATQGTSPWVTSDNHTAAASPLALRLTDGTGFYTAPTSTQLPAALDGSGFLKTHEQGTAAVSIAALPSLAAGTAVIGHVISDSGSTTAVTGTVTTAPVTVASASTPSTCTAVTSTATLLAANASRKGFAAYAKSTNTKAARFSFSTTATTSQEELLAGSRIDYDRTTYQGAVSFISDDGTTSITVCVREW